ncbi:ATPase, P-type (transporting), HAD superfamily, subfamily IC/heavy metal translocating P-type ATPase [Cupriavidus sp. YR651]|uniref:heavy metal translocating P-type ATPase n=1 Tax=Cupriavidus sp. YR651 TaxID=1855315 RepID=UPI00087F8556|nr:heavy metal translocating P-type ATPase [Cupriavidus sp. YR651]SDD81843.1 ATPase, P-type (transporting), HAD superfamily, subfamily IC/heavy metal translocating P-type ATPase [Cupriavidus sp. YR651]
MHIGFRKFDLGLLPVAAGTLGGGVLLFAFGAAVPARLAWASGALVVAVALIVAIVQSLRRKEAGVDVLALLAIGLALALGEFLASAVLALMIESGRAIENYAQARSEREMSALLSRAPQSANRFEDGEWRAISLDVVSPGDRLLVRHGEVVPVDGALLGQATLDESALTGESLPRARLAGETVRSSVLNAGAPFEMVAATTAADSTFAGIARMVRTARDERPPAARLADRYALWLVPITLLVAGLAWFASGELARVLAVLVVATPCPLILAVPVAIVSGVSRCAGRGVLVKGGGALESLSQVSILFFDKTGTLTGGRVRLAAIESAPGWQAPDVLRVAASLAQASGHVVAEAITAEARERGLTLDLPTGVAETAGAGVAGRVGERAVTVGSPAFACGGDAGPPWCQAMLQRAAYEGASVSLVTVDSALVGALQFVDLIRMDTPRALRLLRKAGIRRLAMLTGDRPDVAETIGAMLGVTEVHANLSPTQKLAEIEAARREGIVLMVGDGVNDAPALAAADVGVAMGARGAAASSEAADVVLLVDRLDRLVDAVRIARRSRRLAVQSAMAGMGLSFVAMAIAAFGYLPPLAGAALQEVIDVLVIANALRALRADPSGPAERLSTADAERLNQEHAALAPLMEQIRSLADRLPAMPSQAAGTELCRLCASLSGTLLPHEQNDDAQLYPQLARLVGGDDPLAAMSGMHREIFRVIRLLQRMADDSPPDGPDAGRVREYQRLLYGLDAVLRLHCAQEDELFHALREDAPTE